VFGEIAIGADVNVNLSPKLPVPEIVTDAKTVKVELTDCRVLVPVRAPASVALTAMLEVKTKVSPTSDDVKLWNRLNGESVFGEIAIGADVNVNLSPKLPVPEIVTDAKMVKVWSVLSTLSWKCPP
jgi:hypothetical protein